MLQFLQRVSHGGAAHVQPFGEVDLIQRVPRHERSAEDERVSLGQGPVRHHAPIWSPTAIERCVTCDHAHSMAHPKTSRSEASILSSR